MNQSCNTTPNTEANQNDSTPIEKWLEVRREIVAQSEGGAIVRVTGRTRPLPGDIWSEHLNHRAQKDADGWTTFSCPEVTPTVPQSTDDMSESPSQDSPGAMSSKPTA